MLSLRGAQRRGNPGRRQSPRDCFAALAKTPFSAARYLCDLVDMDQLAALGRGRGGRQARDDQPRPVARVFADFGERTVGQLEAGTGGKVRSEERRVGK